MAEYPVIDGAGGTIIATEKDAAYDVDTNYPVLDGSGAEIVSRKYDVEIDLGPEVAVSAFTEWADGGGAWTLSADAISAAGTPASATSPDAVEAGETYRVVITWEHTSGTLYARVGAGTAQTVTVAAGATQYEFELTAVGTSGFEMYGGSVAGELTALSVKKVL